jgi:hypothetical protein
LFIHGAGLYRANSLTVKVSLAGFGRQSTGQGSEFAIMRVNKRLPMLVFVFRKKPCKDHWLFMEQSKRYYMMCRKCGWKIYDAGWHLRPVKFENRWYFDH